LAEHDPSGDEAVVSDEGVGKSFVVSAGGSERPSEASLDSPAQCLLVEEDLAGESRDEK